MHRVLIPVVTLMVGCCSAAAFADCTAANNLIAPHMRATWVEGGLVYDTTTDTLKTCDGTNYTEIATGSSSQWTTSGTAIYYNGGNVGIGTSSPVGKLNIAADAGILRLTDTDTALSDGEDAFGIEFANHDSDGLTGPSARIKAVGDGSIGYTSLAFQVGAAGGTLADSMRIDGTSGNVGIGNTSPQATLQVSGSLIVSTSAQTTTPSLYVDTNGYVGVWTSNPLYRLHVNGGNTVISDSLATIAINTTGSAANNGMTIAQYGTGDANLSFLLPGARRWNLGVDNSDGDKFKILADNSNDYSGPGIVIDTSGNVGINTTSPGYPLDVNGTIKAVGVTSYGSQVFYVGSLPTLTIASDTITHYGLSVARGNFLNVGTHISGYYGLSLYTAGVAQLSISGTSVVVPTLNVGIGTTNPSSTLHIPDGKYAQFSDVNAGAPPGADCDNDNELGRQSIDSSNFRLYICMGAARGWDYVALTN